MKYDRGIYRALFVVSIFAFFLGGFIYIQYYANRGSSDLEVLLEAVVIGSVFFALPWAIYFIVLWIIKGFRDDEKKK